MVPPGEPVGEFAGIASRIKEVRTTLGLTQADFAEVIGVSRSSLAEMEGGQTPPTLRAIVGIARMDLVLGPKARAVGCEWLIRGEGNMFGPRRKEFWDEGSAGVEPGPDTPEYLRRFMLEPSKRLSDERED